MGSQPTAFKHNGVGASSPLPFVEEHEMAEAKKLIDDQFVQLTGKPFNFRPAGYMVICKIYVSPDELMEVTKDDGTKVTLYTAPMQQQQDVLKSVAALVCAVGPQAYKGNNPDGSLRYPEGPWVRCGDWCVIPRHSSFIFQYRGVAMAVIPDDKILGVIEDPRDVSEIYVAPKV